MELFDFLKLILHKYRQLFNRKKIVHIPRNNFNGLNLNLKLHGVIWRFGYTFTIFFIIMSFHVILRKEKLCDKVQCLSDHTSLVLCLFL